MLRLPDVAFTVIVYVPASVPVTGGGVVELPPPPQPGSATIPAIAPTRANCRALFLTGIHGLSSNVKTAPSEAVNMIPGRLPVKGALREPKVGAGCELE